MSIIPADQGRMIDLPGVGPCPRPTDIDESVTGFARLKSLRIYRFAPGVTIDGDSETDEVFVIPLDGTIDISITGKDSLQASVGPGAGARAVFMAPDHAYRLTPQGETHVAYARAAACGRVAVQAVSAAQSDDLAEALSFAIRDLGDGETIAAGGARETLVHVISGALAQGDRTLEATATLMLHSDSRADLVARGATKVLIVTA
ncbi:hypothetical protein [Oceaniglobus trochenteri]|uniref:hypothetical protein n=1 Tax=Oceaniglobus trochenteri TaxID=2763260 RepID=UPI001D0014A3|nr:hypothetical protein [Oceaniglobus trochenteri]